MGFFERVGSSSLHLHQVSRMGSGTISSQSILCSHTLCKRIFIFMVMGSQRSWQYPKRGFDVLGGGWQLVGKTHQVWCSTQDRAFSCFLSHQRCDGCLQGQFQCSSELLGCSSSTSAIKTLLKQKGLAIVVVTW